MPPSVTEVLSSDILIPMRGNDLAILQRQPKSNEDPTVPLATEFVADAIRRVQLAAADAPPKEWVAFPFYSNTPPRTIKLSGGAARFPFYPQGFNLPDDIEIILPPLSSTSSTIKETQYLYLFIFNGVTGAEHDPALGQVQFPYTHPETKNVEVTTKENARRLSAYWGFLLATKETSPEELIALLDDESDGYKYINIVNNSPEGFARGGFRVWAMDPNLAIGKKYRVPDFQSFDLLPLCKILRQQNISENGYTHGHNGEEDLEFGKSIFLIGEKPPPVDPSTHLSQRLLEIFSGKPGNGRGYGFALYNLTSGPVQGNPGKLGQGAATPNNSANIADGQRITYTGQQTTSRYAAAIVATTNDGNGLPLATLSLQVSIGGTVFSEKPEDHRVYALDGTDISSLGTFKNLGGTGYLSWSGGPNSTNHVLPGEKCVIAPGIKYPAGSGFNLPFESVVGAWQGGVSLHLDNIRMAGDDIEEYIAPANDENFILIFGKERCALHYIYKKTPLDTGADGLLRIPEGASGKIAFIEGVAGRIDSPFKSGLAPATTYNCLLYYAPKVAESWQFQFRYPQYGGGGDALWLDGAEISSFPRCYLHTQGGGQSVFRGETDLQFSPISMHLPLAVGDADSEPDYKFDAPIQLKGDSYSGPDTFREYRVLPAAGYAIPRPGQTLHAKGTGKIQPRSLQVRLSVGGNPVGFRTPVLESNSPFQTVVAFSVKKGMEKRLCILTRNGRGGESVMADSDAGVGIDIFEF